MVAEQEKRRPGRPTPRNPLFRSVTWRLMLPLWMREALLDIGDEEKRTYSGVAQEAVLAWLKIHHPEKIPDELSGGRSSGTDELKEGQTG